MIEENEGVDIDDVVVVFDGGKGKDLKEVDGTGSEEEEREEIEMGDDGGIDEEKGTEENEDIGE